MMIANRVLNFSGENGDIKIPIRIFAPERKGAAEWSCHFEIDWPDDKRQAAAVGLDSVQAIVLAFQMIGSEIYATSYHKSGKLFLEAPGRGYGFPVTAGIRDLLIGDDAKYF
jgi:hypothetical protein